MAIKRSDKKRAKKTKKERKVYKVMNFKIFLDGKEIPWNPIPVDDAEFQCPCIFVVPSVNIKEEAL